MQIYSALHQAARAYAKVGIPVFPCLVGGKRPATDNGFHDATIDLQTIDLWWGTADYNLAFSPGHANLFVVDADPGADPAFIEKCPSTYTVRTPRGGYHFYYEGVGPTTTNKLAEHVDTRSEGGYVLAPPSQVYGKYLKGFGPEDADKLFPYYTEKPLAYAPLPEWMPTSIKKTEALQSAADIEEDLPENVARATALLKQYVEMGHVSVVGNGGDALCYEVCCDMLDLGLSVKGAADLMEDIWNNECDPPWTFDELQQKLENASRYRQNKGAVYALRPVEETFEAGLAKLREEEKLNPPKLSRFHFKDEAELDDEPDPLWLVKDLMSERSTVMMFGKSGSYKSFIAMMLSLSLSTGKQTFGSETKPGLVFYAALEGKAHLKKARMAWRVLHGIEGKIENFFVGRAPMIGVGGEIQEFGDQIAKRCNGRIPTLIVIDTLTKTMAGLNENDAEDAGKFIQFCDSLVEHFGCTVMAVHHQSDKEGSKGARGSSAFFAGFDTVLEVTAHKPTKAVAVYVRKHKDAEEREQPWTFEGQVVGPSLIFQPTTFEQHRLLCGETKELTGKNIGAALRELSAFGEEAAVTTTVLATQLTPATENGSVEARAEAIARTGRALSAASHKSLEAYNTRKGKTLIWSLPAPVA